MVDEVLVLVQYTVYSPCHLFWRLYVIRSTPIHSDGSLIRAILSRCNLDRAHINDFRCHSCPSYGGRSCYCCVDVYLFPRRVLSVSSSLVEALEVWHLQHESPPPLVMNRSRFFSLRRMANWEDDAAPSTYLLREAISDTRGVRVCCC